MNKAFYIFQSQALNLGHLSPKDFVAVHLTSFKFNAIHTHTHMHTHTHTHTHTHIHYYHLAFYSMCSYTKSLHSCPNLFNAMNCRLPGSTVQWILQVRKLEWISMPYSGHLPNLGIEPVTLISSALAEEFFIIYNWKGRAL